MRELISTSKRGEKVQAGIEWSNILAKILASEEKATIMKSAKRFELFVGPALHKNDYNRLSSLSLSDPPFGFRL